MSIHDRLRARGIALPHAAAPVASYQPVVVDGHTAFVSGQLPFVDGELVTGKLGEGVTLEQGQQAARACGLMILAQLEAAGLIEAQLPPVGVPLTEGASVIYRVTAEGRAALAKAKRSG